MDFEWDDAKADSNEQKHGVSFTEAMTVFADPLSLTGYDPDHSDDENRYITMGLSAAGRLLVVSHTDRGEKVRIISARKASGRIMKMAASPDQSGPVDDELRAEYDFRSLRGVVRGKYAARYRERLRVVRLADDVADAFADEAAVNDALREYLRIHPDVNNSA
jgi:uncharacterized DUF497 family protein